MYALGLIAVLIGIFLMTDDVGHLFMFLFSIHLSFLVKCLSIWSKPSPLGVVSFLSTFEF